MTQRRDHGADRQAALRAAALLPTAEDAVRANGGTSGREAKVWALLGIVTLVGGAVCALVAVWVKFPGGWIAVVAGLLIWVLTRSVVLRGRGFETAAFAVDQDGTVHIVTGHRAVRRMSARFDVDTYRRLKGPVVLGCLAGVLIPILPAVLAAVFNSPVPALVLLTTPAFAAFDVLRWYVESTLRPRWKRQTLLDSSIMLPAIALYARRHDWHEVCEGVPANELLATLAEHPEDLQKISEHAAVTSALQRLSSF